MFAHDYKAAALTFGAYFFTVFPALNTHIHITRTRSYSSTSHLKGIDARSLSIYSKIINILLFVFTYIKFRE